MEGLLPYIYRAIVQYRGNAGQRIYGALASSSPGDSGRFSWDSAYIRLPGDSGRFTSDIHGLLAESMASCPQTIYRRPPPQSPTPSNNAVTINNDGRHEGSASRNTSVRITPVPAKF